MLGARRRIAATALKLLHHDVAETVSRWVDILRVDPDNRFIHAAAEAMKQVFGKETVYIRSGGSIPIVAAFEEHLGIPSVMMGFGLPDDNLHAPNEKLHLPNFFRGIEAVARYIEILGA